MNTKKIFKAIKVFVISSAVAFTLLNAQLLYTEVRYFIAQIGTTSKTEDVRAAEYIKPVKLPVSDFAERALPDQATLTIEQIGVSAPIVFGVNQNDFDEIYKNLSNGVVHFDATPKPGDQGTAMIIGHSSDYIWKHNQFAQVFALLGKLEIGDTFSVRYSDGRTFTFAVKQSFIFDPTKDNDAKLTELENNAKPTVLLETCWPVTSTAKRLVVQGEIIN